MPEGFRTVIPDDVEVVEQSFETTSEGLSRTVLEMNEAFLEGAGGLLGDMTMLNQIIHTASQFDVDEVLFTVGGEPIEAYGSEGLSLVDPVDGATFIEYLNAIFLDEPVVVGAAAAPHVAGWANVFEAALTVQVVDPATVRGTGHGRMRHRLLGRVLRRAGHPPGGRWGPGQGVLVQRRGRRAGRCGHRSGRSGIGLLRLRVHGVTFFDTPCTSNPEKRHEKAGMTSLANSSRLERS
jgi:hypothetical protein